MAANEKRTMMDELFAEQVRPTNFLSSMAKVRTTLASTIEIDIVRGTEEYAVDITPGAGSRSNKKSKYTTKEYEPPMYNESYPFTAEELAKRLPGQTKYEAGMTSYAGQLVAYFAGKQVALKDKILRSIELQARDAFFSGKITLHNGDEIDFKKKATHSITPSVKWNNASGVPLEDIADACALCRKDGKIAASKFRLIVADDVVEALISNPQFVDRADLRYVERVSAGMPSDINDAGAVYHGIFSAGAYKIELWSYPQFYTVPTGYGLAGEGTMKPYIPTGEALLIPPGIDLRLWFGGVAQVANQVDPAVERLGIVGGRIPTMVEADFVPYGRFDDRTECIEVGVKSRPLFVPVQIDGFATLDTLI